MQEGQVGVPALTTSSLALRGQREGFSAVLSSLLLDNS